VLWRDGITGFGTVRTTLCYIAHLVASLGRFEDASRLLGAVDGLRPPGAGILAPPNRAAYDDAAALAAAAIGSDRFERLITEGRTLSEEAAVRLVFGAERLT
jgi:hypothetical protein